MFGDVATLYLYHLHPHLEQKNISTILEDTHVWLLSFNMNHAFLKWCLMDMVAPRVSFYCYVPCLISGDLFTKAHWMINSSLKRGVLDGSQIYCRPSESPGSDVIKAFSRLPTVIQQHIIWIPLVLGPSRASSATQIHFMTLQIRTLLLNLGTGWGKNLNSP